MSDYTEVINDLERKIQRNHLLGQAQQPDSAHALRYQQRIHALTTALHSVEQAVPHLADLDEQIDDARYELNRAFDAAERRADVWPQLGTWTGVVGAIGLLAGVGFGLPWQVPVLSVLLLLAAAGAAVMTVRQRRDASADLQHAQEVLADLEEQRRAAMPNVAELIGGVA